MDCQSASLSWVNNVGSQPFKRELSYLGTVVNCYRFAVNSRDLHEVLSYLIYFYPTDRVDRAGSDPMMTLVTPKEQYGNYYTFTTPTDTNNGSYRYEAARNKHCISDHHMYNMFNMYNMYNRVLHQICNPSDQYESDPYLGFGTIKSFVSQ